MRCSARSRTHPSQLQTGAAGFNAFRFQGRLGNKTLKKGNYRLVGVATDAAGNASKPARHPFRIRR